MQSTRWFRNGDHPQDDCQIIRVPGELPFWSEGKVVRYFRHPYVEGEKRCERCGVEMHLHGWIDSGGDGQTVCPGDYINSTASGAYLAVRQN